MIRNMLAPLAWLYGAVTALRNRFYDDKTLSSHGFDVAMVSIGNLTLGGTGKTPLLAELVNWAVQSGLKVAVVSRGYKGSVRGFAEVPKDSPDPTVYGDEPVMISSRFPTVPVFVGANRVLAVQALLDAHPDIQVVFADDAFQHRGLGRNIDVVVLDCTEPVRNYRLVPLGRGRENVTGLKRAEFVILNKVNLVSPEQKQSVLEMIERVRGDKAIEIIESEYYVHVLRNLVTGLKCEPSGHEPVYAVSAIGNPKSFEELLKMKLDVKGHAIFRDHHRFDEGDILKVVDEAGRRKVKKIVITEKDATKIKRLAGVNDTFWVAELRPKMSLRARHLHEAIHRHVR